MAALLTCANSSVLKTKCLESASSPCLLVFCIFVSMVISYSYSVSGRNNTFFLCEATVRTWARVGLLWWFIGVQSTYVFCFLSFCSKIWFRHNSKFILPVFPFGPFRPPAGTISRVQTNDALMSPSFVYTCFLWPVLVVIGTPPQFLCRESTAYKLWAQLPCKACSYSQRCLW